MANGYDGKTVLITGGGSGMGLGTAIRFGAEGARVAVWDVHQDRVDQTVAELRAMGAEALGARVDVSSEDQVTGAIAAVASTFGRIDAVINCAGFLDHARLADLEKSNWDRQIGVMLTGTYLVCRHTLSSLKRAGGGSIVNISSVSAHNGGGGRNPAYAAAKAGIIGLTRSMAIDLSESNIRVNALLPGPVETRMTEREPGGVEANRAYLGPMTLVGRMGQPKDIADLIYYLCSDAGSFITGADIVVDGGFLLNTPPPLASYVDRHGKD